MDQVTSGPYYIVLALSENNFMLDVPENPDYMPFGKVSKRAIPRVFNTLEEPREILKMPWIGWKEYMGIYTGDIESPTLVEKAQ